MICHLYELISNCINVQSYNVLRAPGTRNGTFFDGKRGAKVLEK